jgi:hypothetical protein
MGRKLKPRRPRSRTQPCLSAHFRQSSGAGRLSCASRSRRVCELGTAICVFGDGPGLLGEEQSSGRFRRPRRLFSPITSLFRPVSAEPSDPELRAGTSAGRRRRAPRNAVERFDKDNLSFHDSLSVALGLRAGPEPRISIHRRAANSRSACGLPISPKAKVDSRTSRSRRWPEMAMWRLERAGRQERTG